MKITRDDIIKLAHISMISISDEDIAPMMDRLNRLLEYVSGLKEIVGEQKVHELPHNVNVFRPDVVVATDPEPLLALAPKREGNYYVVPKILKD